MQNDYLTRQKPMKALIIFSFPIIMGNLFQQFYVMADSAIVGRYVSQTALAAVGASYSLTNIFVWVAVGGGMGASVIVSRYFGAKQYKQTVSAISTALISFLLISILLGTVGLFFGEKIMMLLDTPSDALEMATEYLRIYFIGLPFLFMYNVLSSMFNALGKSGIPLGLLIFSSLFNIYLDWLLVTRFSMGVAGVAWATLIAQGISAVLSFIVLTVKLSKMKYGSNGLFVGSELPAMLRVALPSILQQSTVSIGMMLVQSVVNHFGTETVAGFSAAMRIESLCIVPMVGISSAVSSYTAQNIGAHEEKRVTDGYRSANIISAVCAAIILVILEFFNKPIIDGFLGDDGTAAALDTGADYLGFMGFFFCLIGFKMTVDGLLRGAGDMKIFTLANLVNLFIRVVVAKALAPRFGVAFVWYAVPIGWFANWLISYIEYRTGKWKHIYTGEKQTERK